MPKHYMMIVTIDETVYLLIIPSVEISLKDFNDIEVAVRRIYLQGGASSQFQRRVWKWIIPDIEVPGFHIPENTQILGLYP